MYTYVSLIYVAVSLIHGSIFDSLLESGQVSDTSPTRERGSFPLSDFRFSHILNISVQPQVGTFKPLPARFSKIFFPRSSALIRGSSSFGLLRRLLFEAVLGDEPVQGSPADSQGFGGLDIVAVLLPERPQDEQPFRFVETQGGVGGSLCRGAVGKMAI
jgi:hypothetical protein